MLVRVWFAVRHCRLSFHCCCELDSVNRRCCFVCCVLLHVLFCKIGSISLRVVSLCALRACLAMPPTARMTPDEKRIARDMHKRGLIPKHFADQLVREHSTITRFLAHAGPAPRQGRPEALSDVQVARCLGSRCACCV